MRRVAYHLAEANPRGPARPRAIDPVAMLVVVGVIAIVGMLVLEVLG